MNIQEARKRLPELAGLSDESALNVIHEVYYPTMDRVELGSRLGVKPVAPPVPERSAIRAMGDTAIHFGRGAVSGVRMMSDLAGADNMVSAGLRSADQAMGELLSATAKQDQQRIAEIMQEAEGKGWGDQIVAGLKAAGVAPGALLAQAAGTTLPTLAVAAIPGAGPAAAAARLGAAGAIGAGQGAGNIKGQIYETTKAKLLQSGLSEAEAEARAVQAQAYDGPNSGQIAMGGALGAAAGSTGAERAVSALRNGVTKSPVGLMGRVVQGGLAEAVPEALQGGQEKYATNTALNNEGFQVDPWSGVVAQGTMEGVAGLGMGAATGLPAPRVHADAIRATEKVPESGPLSRAANAGVEARAQAVEATGVDPTAQVPDEQQEPVDDPMVDRIKALPADKRTEALRAYAVLNRDGLAKGVVQYNRKLLDRLLEESDNKEPAQKESDGPLMLGYDQTPTGVMLAGPDGVRPEGRADVVNREQELGRQRDLGLTPDVLRAPRSQAMPEPTPQMAAPEVVEPSGINVGDAKESTPPTSTPQSMGAFSTPQEAAAYISAQRRSGGSRFQALPLPMDDGSFGVVTSESPDFGRAQAFRVKQEREAAGIVEGDTLNKLGQPFKTKASAVLAAKKTGGEAVPVTGGFVVRQPTTQMEAPTNAIDQTPAPAVATDEPQATDPVVDSMAAPAVDAEPEPVAALTQQQDADGVSASWVDMTPDQRRRSRLEQEIATGKTNNGGVMASLRPAAIAQRKRELELMGDAGRLLDVSQNKPKIDTSAERAPKAAVSEQVKKPPFAGKEDVERLFGVPQKRKAAIDRIAKGTAYFGTKEKASDFIAKSGIKDTHEAVQTKPGRFEVRAKDGEQSNMQTADAPADYWGNPNLNSYEHAGRADFKSGNPRTLPRYFTEPRGGNAKAWLRGWDRAQADAVAQPKIATPGKPGVVNVPPDVSEAMTGQMQKQKNRIARLKREAEASGMTLDEKKQAQTKVLAAETTLRKMRTTLFDAEDAAIKALDSGNPADFAAHADVFSDAADVVQSKSSNTSAPAPAETSQLVQSMNDLADVRARIADQGRVTDDRLLQRERQLKKMVKELEADGKQDENDAEMQAYESGLNAKTRAADREKVANTQPNTIFTEDAAAAARARLKSKLGRLNVGIDPETVIDGITLAGYHIEKGARTFAAYAKAMLEDLGDGVKPYLKSWYAAVSLDPRAAGFSDGLTPLGDVMAADVDKLAPKADTGVSKDGNAAQQLDRTGTGTLGGAPAQDVRAADEGQQAGTGPDGSGRGDSAGDARPDDAGGNAGGSLGGDTGAVPVPRRGTRAGGKDAKKPRVPGASRADEGMGLFGPATGGLTPDDSANPAPNAPPIAPPQPTAQDFTITDDLALGEGGEKTKFKNNVAAIRLMRDLESTGRMATPDEQAVLAKYVGWGGLSQAFDANNQNWTREHAEITELMSPQELAAAARSTRYAHYTSREIIQDGIYAAMRHFGFTGGRTLEAGAGVGNFIGLMPADMRSAGRFTAVEREPFSSAIARQLYPQQNVQRADFTEFKGTDAYFDAAVGNPPFASDAQTDASGRKHLSGLSLHNYFFAKAVDMLREGGIMAQVVTNSFMDAKGDKARKYISDRAELLGAIRLPNNAFAKNAGTQVTTDLIFLKKRPDSEVGGKAARADAKRWMDTGIFTDEDGNRVALNQYFIDNPSMMLGKFGAYGTMYGPNKPALVSRPGQDSLAMLKEAVGKLPAGVYKSIADTGADAMVSAAVVALKNPSVQEGGYFLEGDKLMQRLPDIAGEARGMEITSASPWTAKTTLGESGYERIKALAGMRSTVRGLLAAEMADDAKAMKALRDTLNQQYDTYRDIHGLINDPSTLRVFDDDPDYPLLASLEHGYTPGIGPVAAKRMGVKPTTSAAKKGPIFTQRVVAARTAVQKVDTPADALAVSMAERGRLDAPYIGSLLGMEPEQVLQELSTGDKPMLFRDPVTDEYVLRDAYLSGNVRAKLAQAKAAGMFTNANALEAVQPEDVASHEIVARLGSPWVPTAVYEDFARALFGDEAKARVFYLQANSSYQISVQGASDVALTNAWGTNKFPGDELLQAVMNNRTIKVTYRDSDGKTHTDVDGTEKANDKATELKAKFNDWIFSDSDRSEVLTKAYNETNNNYVTRVYDGSAMTFPGKVPDSIIKFRRHQRNAIARIVQDRTALLDHVVGAGKTFTVISGAMELKRTGLARKPMVAVPNHLVKQWAADFYRLYPGANVLTATKKDFEKANRRKFLAKIATGDWDAVVIAHSSYGFIKPAPDFEAEFNNREVAKIMATIKAVEEDDSGDKQTKKRTVKQLEGMKERLENRIKALRDKPMDDLLDFEQIGVDQLFVDEAHMFKNLMFTTKMQGVAGLNDPSGSQRAYDMYVKTNQIMEKNGRGQGVVFATGTPVSNSLAEMYHMMRYLMPNQMRELGFESFDAWANTYASVDQVWMQAPSGDGFKAQNRMSNFVNTPELLKMFDQVSDTVTMDDIKKAYAEENKGAEFPLPKVKGGRRSPVSLEKSGAQNAYMDEIAKRAKDIERRKGPPVKGDDNILVVMGDARKAAMDIRLVDPDVMSREAGGRIDRATDEVLARYKQYDSVKGTQLVFSDLGTPLKHAKKEMAEYEALQSRIQGATEEVAASATLGNEAAMETMEDAEAAQAELDAMGADWLSSVKSALRGFSVYDDFRAALVEKGIPAAEIAFIHDYNTDDQKAGLFRKVNAGQIRVLLGSTAKLGAGTNVQERLVALHHLDVPWRPSDVEQREGRIERQGNRLMTEWPGFEVEILAYVTRDTLDMRMWQVQETKLKMINQLRTRKIGREIDNAFEDMELSAGEMQAAATGDINLLKEIQLRNDVKKLEQRKRAFDGQRNDLLSRKRRTADALRELPKKVEEAAAEAKAVTQYLRDVQVNRPQFAMNIDGKDYTDADEAQKVLREKDEATEEITAQNGETSTKKAPLSVTIDGELIKNRSTMAELFSNARGDVKAIAWEVNGETYRRRTVLANAIRAKVRDAIAEENTQQVGTIGAYSVAVEGSTDKDGTPVLEVTMRRDGNVMMSNSLLVSDSGRAPDRVVAMVENLMDSAVSEANYLTRRLEDAKKQKIDLDKAAVSDQWPDQGKLDAARAAHKEILGNLKQKEDAPAAGDDAETSLSIDDSAAPADTATYEPASQPHRDAVASIRNSLNAKRAARGKRPLVWDAVAPPAGPAGRIQRETADAAKRLFGVDVVWVSFEDAPLFNGAISNLAPGKVFLNIRSEKPFMAVLGHEMLHQVAKVQPSIYANLSRRLGGLIKNKGVYADRLRAKYDKQGLSLRDADVREELEADIVGDNFMDPEFWQALGKDQPGLFRRIANAIMKWLDDVAAKIGKQRPFGTDEFLTDIAAAREAVASAMRQFSGAEVGAVADGADASTTRLSIADSFDRGLNNVRDLNLPAGYKVNDLFQSKGKLHWWHKTVGTQYNLAQRSPEFRPVFDTAQNFINDVAFYASSAADQAPKILPKLETLKDIGKSPFSAADNKAIAAPIFEGTLVWMRDADGKPVKADPASDAPAGIVFTPDELRSLFNLTDEQVGLYQEFRAAADMSLASMAVGDIVRFGGKDLAAVREQLLEAETVEDATQLAVQHLDALAEASPSRAEVLRDTAERIQGKADKARDLMDRGYAPLTRYGQHSLDVVDTNGERVYFGLFESRAEANKMARQMKDNFPGSEVNQGTMSQEEYKLFSGVSPETVELFGDMLGLEATGDGEADQAFQSYLKLAKANRSAMKRLIHRKGIAGFSEDPGRVLAGFVYSNARQTSSSLHMGKLTEAVAAIPKGQGELKDAAVKLRDYVQNPQEEAQAFRGLLFAQYLGGSIASAIVNTTQPFAVTFPWLSQYGGIAKAAGQMRRATADALKKSTGDTDLDAALKGAEESGIVSPQEVFQLQAQASGRAPLQAGDGTVAGNAMATASNALSKFSLAWGKLFGVAEQFNRRTTFIAAYRTAVEQGMADPAAFAEKAIYETQFIYSKANKPRWARGAIGGTLFTFKQYSVNYLELLHRMATQGGPEGKRAALLALGVLFLLSGAGGLPFAEDVDDLIDGALQRMGYNFSSKQAKQEFFTNIFGQAGAQFVMRGVSGLAGVPIDISGRMGMQNLIPGTGALLKKEDRTRDLMELAGPAGDFAKRIAESGEKLMAGDVLGPRGAVVTVLPLAMRNVAKAHEMSTTGMYLDTKGKKVIDADGFDAAAKAIGFQPNDVARVQDATFEVQRRIGLNKIRESEIAGKWAKGVFLGDQDMVQEARAEIKDWNDNNPEAPIRIQMPQITRRVREMRTSKQDRIAKTAPKEIRDQVKRELARELPQ